MTVFLIVLGLLIVCNFVLLRFSSNKISETKTPDEE